MNPPDHNWKQKGVLRRFSQYEFIDSTLIDVHGLDDFGFIYYPYSCTTG